MLHRLEGSFLGQFQSEENAPEALDQPYPVSSILARTAPAQVPREERRFFVIIVGEFQNYAGQGSDTASIRSSLSNSTGRWLSPFSVTWEPSSAFAPG